MKRARKDKRPGPKDHKVDMKEMDRIAKEVLAFRPSKHREKKKPKGSPRSA